MIFSSEFVSNKYLHLNHCGVQYLWDKDRSMERPNGRADYHILYIYQGVCYTDILGKEVAIPEGNLILYKPYEKQKYSFKCEEKPISCYIHFTGSGCEDLLCDIGFTDCRVINIGKSKTILSIFEKLEKEFSIEQPYSAELCAAYLHELLSLAGRRKLYFENEILLKNRLRIDTIIQYIYDNYSKNLTVEECAKECNLSTSRFAHIFKEAVGKTPLEYITEIRILKARELLSSFDYSMSEIAEAVGFPNQNYFARIFKKYTGISPKQYALHQQIKI